MSDGKRAVTTVEAGVTAARCCGCNATTDKAGRALFGLDADRVTTADPAAVRWWICTECFAAPRRGPR